MDLRDHVISHDRNRPIDDRRLAAQGPHFRRQPDFFLAQLPPRFGQIVAEHLLSPGRAKEAPGSGSLRPRASNDDDIWNR